MTVDRWGVSSRDRHGVIDTKRYRGEQAQSAGPGTGSTVHLTDLSRSIQMYSMYEAFARERMRQQLDQAAQHRLSSQLASARMWRRLAAYSASRAARSSRRVAEQAAADYQLAG